MARNVRSGLALAILGAIGGAFFALTDPRYGLTRRFTDPGKIVDLANEALPATLIGIIGSAVILLIGVWLMTRRAG